ncbi:MAG TPA: hypothetical protein PKA88_28090, partial [Polyangiaceae bacterium]|nr:hypothetical protein [Polyangiaceae bacterium]
AGVLVPELADAPEPPSVDALSPPSTESSEPAVAADSEAVADGADAESSQWVHTAPLPEVVETADAQTAPANSEASEPSEIPQPSPLPPEPVATTCAPAEHALATCGGTAEAADAVDAEEEEPEFESGPRMSLQRERTPLPPLLGPASSRVIARRSSVDDLLQSFSVERVGEDGDLCRGLKELAGIEATGAPPAVEDCTPPPVAVEERSDTREPKAAPGRPRPLVGALALLLAVGVAGSSALPEDHVATLQLGAGAVRQSAAALSQGIEPARACEAEIVVRDVPRGAEVSARGGPELSRVLASHTDEDRAVFAHLPCGEALEVRVRRARAKGWLSIPVTAARLSPQPGTTGRVRVTLIAR